MRNADRCQSCGAIAPTRYVDFKQNIGMLVARRHSTVAGNLCKPCVHQHFWKMTGTTLAVGWIGQISIFIAPIFVVNNVVRYVSVLGMPGPDGGKAAKPRSAVAMAPTARISPVARSSPPPLPVAAEPIPFDDAEEAAFEPPMAVELLPDPAEVLKPYWAGMVARIKAKESLADVAADVADQTGLTADEVSDYVKDRVRRANAAKAAKAAALQPARV